MAPALPRAGRSSGTTADRGRTETAGEAQLRTQRQGGRAPSPGCIFVDTRALVASSGSGAYLKGTTVPPVFGESGLDTGLLDLLGVEQIPMTWDGQLAQVTAGVTTAWLSSETTNVTENTPTFGAASVALKRCGSFFQVSRQLLTQTSPAATGLLTRELMPAVQAAIAAALLAGDGTEEPDGIIDTNEVGSVTGTSIDWDAVTDMLADVEANGQLARGSWVMAPDVAKLLRTHEVASGSGMIFTPLGIGGYPAYVSPAVLDGALVFGDWSQVVIPTWGTLKVGANPYQAVGFRAGIVQVKLVAAVDVAVLRPGSFSKSESIT